MFTHAVVYNDAYLFQKSSLSTCYVPSPWRAGKNSEKEVASHSSILAWRIPWTEEPGRLQSKGSQRVEHD